jgi:uncharacterized membrane protein YbhN (UPF0104 family)
MKTVWTKIKKILPWLATVALFIYLFHEIPPQKVAQALVHVRPILFTVYALAYFLLVMLIDCYSLSWAFSKFCVSTSFQEILPARGASYLLALVNYNAGQAGVAYFLKRTKNASFFKALGTLLFILVIDFYWVVLFAFLGSFFIPLNLGPFDINQWVQKVALVLFVALLVHLAFWRGWFAKLIRFKIRSGFFDWIRGRHLFQTFHAATLLDYLKIATLRFPIHVVIISSLYFAVTTFRAHIPFFTILTTTPVILLIGTLPVTPGGLGTVQAATLQFLKDYITGPVFSNGQIAPEEILFALSLSWMFANYLLKAIFGAACLKIVGRSFFKEKETEVA